MNKSVNTINLDLLVVLKKMKEKSTSEYPWHLLGKGYVYNANFPV